MKKEYPYPTPSCPTTGIKVGDTIKSIFGEGLVSAIYDDAVDFVDYEKLNDISICTIHDKRQITHKLNPKKLRIEAKIKDKILGFSQMSYKHLENLRFDALSKAIERLVKEVMTKTQTAPDIFVSVVPEEWMEIKHS